MILNSMAKILVMSGIRHLLYGRRLVGRQLSSKYVRISLSCIKLHLIPFHIHQSKTNKQKISLAAHLSSSWYLGNAVKICIRHRTEQMPPSVLSFRNTFRFCFAWSIDHICYCAYAKHSLGGKSGARHRRVRGRGCSPYCRGLSFIDTPLWWCFNSMTVPHHFSPNKMLSQN